MLIVFDGIDGSGKSSVLEAVRLRLLDAGIAAETTSEFGRQEDWSRQAREKLLASRNAQEELHHVMNARVAHLDLVLGPLLAQDKVVLMDRYIMSTIAYQSSITISLDFLIQRHRALGLPVPDITVLIDVTSETAAQRKAQRQGANKIDQRPRAFFDEARARYRRAAQRLLSIGWDVQVVDGELPLAALAESIASTVLDKILGAQVPA